MHLEERLEQWFEPRLEAFSLDMRASLEAFRASLNLPPPPPLQPKNRDGDLPPPCMLEHPCP